MLRLSMFTAMSLTMAVSLAGPSVAAGPFERAENVSRPAAQAAVPNKGKQIAAVSCEWVWREKLCQTAAGRRMYPQCC